MKTWWSALSLVLLVLAGCDRHAKVTDAPDLGRESGGFSLAIPIPKAAVGTVARVEYVVSGADMDTLKGPAAVEGDTLVRVAIEGVKPGKARTVALNAYDGNEKLVYSGSATTDVAGGETARVDILLRRLEQVPEVGGRTITETLPGGVTMEFVWIPPGTFTMGTTAEQEQLLRSSELWGAWFVNEQPAHPVTISTGFFLGKYEIAQAQWQAVMGTRPWAGQTDVREYPANPAGYLSWEDMQAFIHRSNQAAGDSLYRLPTEAEWEYACRAGTSTEWSFGDDASQLGEYAWYDANAWLVGEQYAHAVGTKLPNPWGLYDMHGNAFELCQDWWGTMYTTEAQTDPTGPVSGSSRVIRSGNFYGDAGLMRSAFRVPRDPLHAYVGARLVRMATPLPMTTTPNTQPVADAGADQAVAVGAQVQLDGSGSRDADGDVLSYQWTTPSGISLSSVTVAQPQFTASTAGTYRFRLIVNDGKTDSPPDFVTVVVSNIPQEYENYTDDLWQYGVNWYRPQVVVYTRVPPSHWVLPAFLGDEQIFGEFTLGDGSDPTFPFAVDLFGMGKNLATYKLYVDRNQNQDLTDDGDLPEQNALNRIQIPTFLVSYSTGNSEPYSLSVYVYFADWDLDYQVAYYRDCGRFYDVEIEPGQTPVAVLLLDDNADGMYNSEGIDYVCVDVDRNGQLQCGADSGELVRHFDSFVMGGIWYVVEDISVDGTFVSFKSLSTSLLTGVVRSSATGAGLVGAKIEAWEAWESRRQVAFTADDGSFLLTLTDGQWNLRASMPGYIPIYETMQFSTSQPNTWNVDLHLIPNPLNGTVELANGDSYDFATGERGRYTGGDFSFGSGQFGANNLFQRGIQDLGDMGDIPLSEIEPPSSGYTQYGVAAIEGHTYVSLAREGEEGGFIVFRVVSLSASGVSIEFHFVNPLD